MKATDESEHARRREEKVPPGIGVRESVLSVTVTPPCSYQPYLCEFVGQTSLSPSELNTLKHDNVGFVFHLGSHKAEQQNKQLSVHRKHSLGDKFYVLFCRSSGFKRFINLPLNDQLGNKYHKTEQI